MRIRDRRVRVTWLLLLPLCGCAVGPDFRAPEAAAPDSWQSRHGGSADLAAPAAADGLSSSGDAPGSARLPGWADLPDATLQELLSKADTANSDVQVAALRLAAARKQRVAVSAAGLPQVTGSAAATRQRISRNGSSTRILDAIGGANKDVLLDFLSSPYSVYDAGFDFSWELDLWGRVRRSLEAADATTAQMAGLLQQARLSVRAEVARSYFSLRAVQAQLASAREQLRAAEQLGLLVDAQADSGVASDLQAVQQQGVVAELRARLPDLLRQEALAVNQLTLLCELQPGAINDRLLRTSATVDTIPPDLKLGLPSQLAARRPDIQAALARLHAATANVGVATADFYPRIQLTGSVASQSLAAGDLGDWASRQWRVGPSLSVPVFNWGRVRSVVELRKIDAQQAAVDFQHTVLQAWHEVDNAISQYQAERLAHAHWQARRDSARSTLKWATERYRGGLSSMAPVLDAQRALADAESNYALHGARLWQGWVAVLKSLGVPP